MSCPYLALLIKSSEDKRDEHGIETLDCCYETKWFFTGLCCARHGQKIEIATLETI